MSDNDNDANDGGVDKFDIKTLRFSPLLAETTASDLMKIESHTNQKSTLSYLDALRPLSFGDHLPHCSSKAGQTFKRVPKQYEALVRCLAHIGSTFSEVGASGKPGAVHGRCGPSTERLETIVLRCLPRDRSLTHRWVSPPNPLEGV